MIWRAPASGEVEAKANGHGGNGLSNGWHDEEVAEGQERLDNISMQLC